MNNLGSCRRGFSLAARPLRPFHRYSGRVNTEVPVFEPYEENLPLESGYFTFVIDEQGQFRLVRGNTSSHSGMVRGRPIGAAGHLRINRAGNVAEVTCISRDYRVAARDSRDPLVSYLLRAFMNHHALSLSPHAIFRFKSQNYTPVLVSVDGRPLSPEEVEQHLLLLEREGQGTSPVLDFGDPFRSAFSRYEPERPSRLYPMHQDQLILSLEEAETFVFEPGAPQPRLTPDSPPLTAGKKAFVIDRDGWLIVGHGHHLLSGGHPVGAAGQIVIGDTGLVEELNLNFSGHYRPTLDATYAGYTYRILVNHPLLKLADRCRVTGRKFDAASSLSTNLLFWPEDLLGDLDQLSVAINFASL